VTGVLGVGRVGGGGGFKKNPTDIPYQPLKMCCSLLCHNPQRQILFFNYVKTLTAKDVIYNIELTFAVLCLAQAPFTHKETSPDCQ
jgi:hypothetical protein